MSASINRVAAEGFEAGAEVYARARPSYPEAIVGMIRQAVPEGAVLLDLAAGTGKFTEQLDPGGRLVASEPVEGMRRGFRNALPSTPLVASTAEAIPFRDAAFDAVTVAQAFHWFEPMGALREIRRILREGGLLAILFNIRDDSVGWVHRLWSSLDSYDPDRKVPRHRDRSWEPTLEISGLFEPVGDHSVEHVQRMDIDSLVARVASVSFISSLSADGQGEVEAKVREFWLTDPDLAGASSFEHPYRCELTLLRAI